MDPMGIDWTGGWCFHFQTCEVWEGFGARVQSRLGINSMHPLRSTRRWISSMRSDSQLYDIWYYMYVCTCIKEVFFFLLMKKCMYLGASGFSIAHHNCNPPVSWQKLATTLRCFFKRDCSVEPGMHAVPFNSLVLPHMIHVWYIYLHSPLKATIHVSVKIPYMDPMGTILGIFVDTFSVLPKAPAEA